MKNMLTGKNGLHFTARLLRSTALAVTGVALAVTLWMAAAETTFAQNDPRQQLQTALGGTSPAEAGRAELLRAVTTLSQGNRNRAPQIARAAAEARPEWATDVLRAAFSTLGSDDCALAGRILRAVIAAAPDQAAQLTELAQQLAPNCNFPGADPGAGAPDEGGFGAAPLNMNPPPGSIGGRGGQGNLVAICHNGRTIFVSPAAVDAHLGHGDTVGPCQVTPVTNP
jgi:hypothetical protein